MNLSRAARARALLARSPLLHRRRHPRARGSRCSHIACACPPTPRGTSPRATKPKGPYARSSRASPFLSDLRGAGWRSNLYRASSQSRRAGPRAARRPAAAPATTARCGARSRRTRGRRLLRSLRPPRRLKFTREGKYFLGITLGVGFAAINTGNNLLYLLLGMLPFAHRSFRRDERALAARSQRRAAAADACASGARSPGRDRGLQPQETHPLVRDRSRGPSRRAARRQALLLSQDQPQQRAGGRVPALARNVAAATATSAFASPRVFLSACSRNRARFPAKVSSSFIPPSIRCAFVPTKVDAVSAGPASRGAARVTRCSAFAPCGKAMTRATSTGARAPCSTNSSCASARARRAPTSSSLLEVRRPHESGDEWAIQFERRIRDVASRAVAHLKRGDGVTIAATSGDRVRADRSVGADRLLRFLALVEPVDTPAPAAVCPGGPSRPTAARRSPRRRPRRGRRPAARRPPSLRPSSLRRVDLQADFVAPRRR